MITVEMVREAVAKTGYKLVDNCFYDPNTLCACALGQVALAKGLDPFTLYNAEDQWEMVQDYLGLDDDYMASFIEGFDKGVNHMSVVSNSAARYHGAAVRQLLEPNNA